jgi:hypothetical protein
MLFKFSYPESNAGLSGLATHIPENQPEDHGPLQVSFRNVKTDFSFILKYHYIAG